MLLDAEPAAFRAGAKRVVEGEQARLDLRNGEAGHRAGEFLREDQALGGLVALLVGFRAFDRAAVRHLGNRQPVGELQRLLERIREPRADVGPHHDAVDHHVDVVGELLVERRHFGDLVELSIDLDALVALLEELGELLAVFALAAAYHRRQQIEPRAVRQRQNAVDHLTDGLAFDRQAGRGRVGHADARPQQPHVVVDLGDGADGGARVFRGGLLLDRNRRGQAVDLVDVRLLHHFEELARVSRERLHVAALAFRVDRVERQRGLARAGQAGEHHELVARDLHVDVFQIVLARPADRDHAAAVEVAARATLVEKVVHEFRNIMRTRQFRQSSHDMAGRTGREPLWITKRGRFDCTPTREIARQNVETRCRAGAREYRWPGNLAVSKPA